MCRCQELLSRRVVPGPSPPQEDNLVSPLSLPITARSVLSKTCYRSPMLRDDYSLLLVVFPVMRPLRKSRSAVLL